MANAFPGSPQYPAQPYSDLQTQPNLYPSLQPYGGLQPDYPPQAAPMLTRPAVYSDQLVVIRPREKTAAYIFLILAVITILLSSLDIELHYWVLLCGANISLTHVYFSNINGSISHMKSLFCSKSLFPDEQCGSMCNYTQDLQKAGNITQGMGITATVCTGICLLLMLLLLLRPSGHRLKGVIVRVAVIVTAAVWTVGAVVYLGYFVHVMSEESNSNVGFGLVLAMIIIVLQAINCVLGNRAVTKLTR